MDSKICKVCKIEKPVTDFSPNKQCTLGVVGTCRVCCNARVSGWYSKNRKRRQDAANKRNRDRKALMVEHFGGRCNDCHGVFHQCVYEFHHLDPEGKDVNPSKALTWSEERMWVELEKCTMLCSNCHKIRHFGGAE